MGLLQNTIPRSFTRLLQSMSFRACYVSLQCVYFILNCMLQELWPYPAGHSQKTPNQSCATGNVTLWLLQFVSCYEGSGQGPCAWNDAQEKNTWSVWENSPGPCSVSWKNSLHGQQTLKQSGIQFSILGIFFPSIFLFVPLHLIFLRVFSTGIQVTIAFSMFLHFTAFWW